MLPTKLGRRHHRNFDRAALHGGGHLLLATKRSARVDPDLDLAAALLLDQFGELLCTEPLRVIDVVDDRHLDAALFDLGLRSLRNSHREGRREGQPQGLSTQPWHCHSLPPLRLNVLVYGARRTEVHLGSCSRQVRKSLIACTKAQALWFNGRQIGSLWFGSTEAQY